MMAEERERKNGRVRELRGCKEFLLKVTLQPGPGILLALSRQPERESSSANERSHFDE